MPSADQSGGLGGTQPPPQNVPGALTGAAVTPGVSLGQVIARRVIIEGANGSLLVYSSAPPVLGNLISSNSGGNFFDQPGNFVLPGVVSYLSGGPSLFFANALVGSELTWYFATSPAGPYTQNVVFNASSLGALSITIHGALTLSTNAGATIGTIPQAGGSGITTVAQVVSALEAMGLLTP